MIELRRIDPAQNMRRFYRLDIQPDLFGGFLLLKQWGRIGAHGQIKAERYDNEAPALAALHRHCHNDWSLRPRLRLGSQGDEEN
jgi:predicted DNA-binding WGR domain protein